MGWRRAFTSEAVSFCRPSWPWPRARNLFLELRIGAFADFLDLTDTELEFPEGVGDRFHQGLDGGLALLDIAFRFLGLGGQGGFREMQELFGGTFQCVGGKGFEGIGELGLGAPEQRLLFLCRLALGLQAAGGFRKLVAESLRLGLVALAFRLGVGEASLGIRVAALLGFESFKQSGFRAGCGQPGDQPTDEKGGDGGDDEWKVGFEFGRHGWFLLAGAGLLAL